MNWKQILTGLALAACLSPAPARAQSAGDSPELLQIIKSAGNFLSKGEYDQAISMYKQAIRMAPDNIALRKDLAYTYFLKRDFTQAREIITPVVSSSLADAQCYQIAAAIEQADGKNSKAKRIVNSGLEKFPKEGVLYNTKGNILSTESKSSKPALKEWINGIAVEPNYATNYYNAAKVLFQDGNYVWCIIYAEKFINLEAQSPKTVDMRKVLFEAYKKVFTTKTDEAIPAFNKQAQQGRQKLSFEEAFQESVNANISAISDGFNTENISMLRTRFLIYWHNRFEQQFPQSIISYQSRLMKSGFYPAYNQWLFGAIENSQEFGAWVTQFKGDYQKFEYWRQNNPYVPSIGDAVINLK